LKLFHYLLENCWNKGWRNQLVPKATTKRNVAGRLPSNHTKGAPGNQDIAPLCGESLKRKQVITRLEQAGIEPESESVFSYFTAVSDLPCPKYATSGAIVECLNKSTTVILTSRAIKCLFGKMESAQFFSGPTPFCRRDTFQPRKLFIFGRVKRIGSLFGGFANGIQLAESLPKSYRMTYYLLVALGRLKT
jgi:hypothetical protein